MTRNEKQRQRQVLTFDQWLRCPHCDTDITITEYGPDGSVRAVCLECDASISVPEPLFTDTDQTAEKGPLRSLWGLIDR